MGNSHYRPKGPLEREFRSASGHSIANEESFAVCYNQQGSAGPFSPRTKVRKRIVVPMYCRADSADRNACIISMNDEGMGPVRYSMAPLPESLTDGHLTSIVTPHQ